MIGPPGTDKSLLAARLPGILPPMTEAEALESAAILSAAYIGFDPARWGERPFRAPHHSASSVALVGGGSPPRPGEISLAHHGVLFLDELPEFQRGALEARREPVESGTIAIARAARQAVFPARFQFVAAINPCPCAYLGEASGCCKCAPQAIARYRSRISGPLADRIDIKVEAPALRETELTGQAGEASGPVRARVAAARERQLARQGKPNAWLGPRETEKHCACDAAAAELLRLGDREAVVVGAGVPPGAQGGAHDRGSRGGRRGGQRARRGGDPVPAAGRGALIRCHYICIDITRAVAHAAGVKTAHLQIRVTPAEKDRLARAARQAGLGLSAYVLAKVLPDRAGEWRTLGRDLAGPGDRRLALAALSTWLSKLGAGELHDALRAPPPASLPEELANTVAAMVEHACAAASVQPPDWTRDIPPLDHPVFGSTLASLRLHLLANSPPAFRRRNLFVDTAVGGQV